MKELNFEQMENIQAGSTPEEYCATVKMIYDNNPDQQNTDGMNYARQICAKYDILIAPGH
ncbi:hypothetical protein [Marinifilum fragile]|uniref:hypothetical protein n=1 Tax=Marinifilum fragile TaxID=570161 RepID=UPI002AAB93A6|nr:hypothetical protein [Marinifilum fragile]